jgi:nitrite reductase/ring-hydroxylating ferredoxin subunit
MRINRRTFLTAAGGTLACTCLGFEVGGCSMITGTSEVRVAPNRSYRLQAGNLVMTLSKIDALDKPGGAVKLAVSVNPAADPVKILVVRPDEATFIVFQDRCTHGKRELNYRHEAKLLECSSFGHSKFDLRGKVLEGPAKGPLRLYAYEKHGDELFVKV